MLRSPLALLAGAFLAAGLSALAADPPEAERPGLRRVLQVDLDGPITRATADYVTAALARADAERFDGLLVRLDTPGGDLESTRTICRAMLQSRVPVLLWVGPAGARAASAGVFVTMAADVAAMHPTSNIGAAHPVVMGGKDVEEVAGKDMAKKVENDAVAQIRSYADARGRNADWAEQAVRESVSITAEQAVAKHVVDFLAGDVQAVLAKADGRVVRTKAVDGVPASPIRLHVAGAAIVTHQPTFRQRVLLFLSDPNLVLILALVGLLGIGIEFYHPGAIVPGAVGGLCLFLVLVANQVIPMNLAALLLLLAGAGLLVAEAYVTTHGIAAVGGAICLGLGMLFLIDTDAAGKGFDPGALSVSPWIVWPTPLALALLFGLMGWKVARGRRVPLQLGAPGLVGEAGDALSEIGPEGGEAFVHGEYWRARSAAPIARGARVRVRAVEGLVLTVEEDGGLR